MSNLFAFKEILDKMQALYGSKDWISSIGTSLLTYYNDLQKVVNFHVKETGIDLNNESQLRKLSNEIAYRKRPTSNRTKFRQRFNFYQLLGVFINRQNQYFYLKIIQKLSIMVKLMGYLSIHPLNYVENLKIKRIKLILN